MSLQKTWGNIHLTALGAMMLSFLLVGCDDSVAQNAAPPAPTVSAAKVLVKSISQWDSFNGRIEAVESVQLRPRVSGYIDKVNYTDGQEVKKGQVLFTIDDRTYRAALEQAQAALARAKTQASLAQSEANRTDKLVHTNLVSREEWEQRRSAAVQAQADIRAAQAAVDAAQLNLDFTKVTAPIDGRASRALITSGNLVTAGDTASVRLPGSAEFKATLIDDKAVLTDQDRKYVYIVDKDGKAQRRDITPGRLADGLRIVQKGLNPGDSVIVDGLQKVFMPGMPVNAKTVAMTSSATLN
ncbi:TPA: efflux RND transporter periplasmic adaptor subunit [Klebsiella pneumoniae]